MKDELELENQALTAALTLNSAMAVQASAPGGGGGPNQGIGHLLIVTHSFGTTLARLLLSSKWFW